ncbi:hypothetical protein GLOTRDRAFT_95982 [Gloeophyllum trabeum ATCC 11539]|uniref:Uncharacterized protein n=1 Tax=Gloeophyllum trabeum (strain ATCC 11539 / FP-39264 / Madison 617) TaxID=670483 RepID=S7PYH2_GLOTA|nr:uncharacterized protein GLOTRDRAFT_95982 [Gloeophyllum trabeum ATCC 11539]EPQ52397.1 hypothetical protein GLOTRDRAFT_95982 [Gloeophyllum trabeum ATCC 11539]
MQKYTKNMIASALEGNGWQKLANPSVARGKTAFPKKAADVQRLGVRFDYDGEVTRDDVDYHKFQMQPNAGDGIPSIIKRWREANGGTHAVMAVVYVKKDATKEEVKEALEQAVKQVEGV